MQRKTKSLIEELNAIPNNRDMNHIIESRANNVISSAINLIELINKQFSKEKAELLEKKLLSSIKAKQPKKFAKTLRNKP
jgi:response regulator RpfG family c-di-GMP phosphodiesterase